MQGGAGWCDMLIQSGIEDIFEKYLDRWKFDDNPLTNGLKST